jgi:hypothetical protein
VGVVVAEEFFEGDVPLPNIEECLCSPERWRLSFRRTFLLVPPHGPIPVAVWLNAYWRYPNMTRRSAPVCLPAPYQVRAEVSPASGMGPP